MRRVPAILMVIFLVFPLFVAALMTVSISTWALDRSFYLGLVEDERLFQIPDDLSPATWRHAEAPGLEAFSLRSAGKAAREVLTASYLRGQAVRVLNQAFDFLEGPARGFDISLDLAPVKANLLGDPGKRLARVLAQDMPVGGTEADFAVTPGALPQSRPASISVDRAAAIIQAGLPTFVKSMPDTVRLGAVHWDWGPGFSALGALILADIVVLALAGGVLTGAAFVGGGNRFERLQWLGWSLMAPAVAVFLVGLLTTLSISSGWVEFGIRAAKLGALGFDPSFSNAVIEVARRAVTRVGTGFLATGAIAGGVAMGLLAWSWTLARNKEKGATT